MNTAEPSHGDVAVLGRTHGVIRSQWRPSKEGKESGENQVLRQIGPIV